MAQVRSVLPSSMMMTSKSSVTSRRHASALTMYSPMLASSFSAQPSMDRLKGSLVGTSSPASNGWLIRPHHVDVVPLLEDHQGEHLVDEAVVVPARVELIYEGLHPVRVEERVLGEPRRAQGLAHVVLEPVQEPVAHRDRKSTRLNSSHLGI